MNPTPIEINSQSIHYINIVKYLGMNVEYIGKTQQSTITSSLGENKMISLCYDNMTS